MAKRYFCLLLLTAGLVTCQTAFAAEKFELPKDLRSLLPGQAAAFVALTSVNELADQYAEVLNALDEETEASREDVFEMFDHVAANFTEYVNLDRPLGMAVGLPNLMAGSDPPFTIIVPIREGIEDVESLGDNAEFAVTVFEGEYLALSGKGFHLTKTNGGDGDNGYVKGFGQGPIPFNRTVSHRADNKDEKKPHKKSDEWPEALFLHSIIYIGRLSSRAVAF